MARSGTGRAVLLCRSRRVNRVSTGLTPLRRTTKNTTVASMPAPTPSSSPKAVMATNISTMMPYSDQGRRLRLFTRPSSSMPSPANTSIPPTRDAGTSSSMPSPRNSAPPITRTPTIPVRRVAAPNSLLRSDAGTTMVATVPPPSPAIALATPVTRNSRSQSSSSSRTQGLDQGSLRGASFQPTRGCCRSLRAPGGSGRRARP